MRPMYAVIESGGKQERVEVGQRVDVELLRAKPGEEVSFRPVLLVAGDAVLATPESLEEATVSGLVIGEKLGPKIDGFTYKPKTRSRRRWGHRQRYTTVEIATIGAPGLPSPAEAEEAPAPKAEAKGKGKGKADHRAEADVAAVAEAEHDVPDTEVAHAGPETAHEAPETAHEAPEIAHEAPEIAHEAHEAPETGHDVPSVEAEAAAPAAQVAHAHHAGDETEGDAAPAEPTAD
jgi:large subunit ribosomal protein L21